MTTEHAEKVHEFYRKQGEQRALEAITNYLLEQGILRESMFGDSWVAKMADTPEDGTWPILDLPKDLGLSKAQVNA